MLWMAMNMIEIITFGYPVVGMVSTLNNLWIFTKTTVEYIWKDSLTTTGGIASFFSSHYEHETTLQALIEYVQRRSYLLWQKAVKIKSIWYIQGNVKPSADISIWLEWVGINDYMQNEADEDQSDCFGFLW